MSPMLDRRGQKLQECKDALHVFLATSHTSLSLMFITHSFVVGKLLKQSSLYDYATALHLAYVTSLKLLKLC
jgi:hypothetical protein